MIDRTKNNHKRASSKASTQRVKFDAIAKLAYGLWEKQGRVHGMDKDHWYQAEQMANQHASK